MAKTRKRDYKAKKLYKKDEDRDYDVPQPSDDVRIYFISESSKRTI